MKNRRILFGIIAALTSVCVLTGCKDSEEKLTYWHTYDDIEVDAVIGDARVAIEIKSADSIQANHKKGLVEFAKEHPKVKQILVSRDRISRRSGEIDLYYVTDFFKALWNDEII